MGLKILSSIRHDIVTMISVTRQTFPSPRLVATPKTKEISMPYYLNIAEWITDGSFSQVDLHKVKHKEPCPRFELESMIPFPMTIIIMLLVGCLAGWFVGWGFMAYQPFVGYLTPNSF